MRGPALDILYVVIIVGVFLVVTYPLWSKPLRRLVNRWLDAIDEADDDVVDSSSRKFRSRK